MLLCAQGVFSDDQKTRSKANPRSFVFTIGFSAGVVGLAMAKGQNRREANAESFLIDSGIREASNWRVAQRSSIEVCHTKADTVELLRRF
jgi:hypothetical protein